MQYSSNMFNDNLPINLSKQEDTDLIKCPKCKCSWFSEQKFAQRPESHLVILGQSVPVKSPEFVLLICARCGEKLEPRLLRQTRDQLDRKYDEFFEEMSKDEVQSEKL